MGTSLRKSCTNQNRKEKLVLVPAPVVVGAFMLLLPEPLTAPCEQSPACVDNYIWSVYAQTKQIDYLKVKEKVGKKWSVKITENDFTWKDPTAANRRGMSQYRYIIGCVEPAFKIRLYFALRALEEEGFEPGITSLFRDDYRQRIAEGLKSADNRSFHGGSLRGGCGHSKAADMVSRTGETHRLRAENSVRLWKRIDEIGREHGVVRPYGNRDPPHVTSTTSPEAARRTSRTAEKKKSQKKLTQLAKLKSKKTKTTRRA